MVPNRREAMSGSARVGHFMLAASVIAASIMSADAAVALTKLWFDKNCDGESTSMLAHHIGVCTPVQDDATGITYTDKVFVDGDVVTVGGYDNPESCASGAEPDDIVERWRMDGKCHHGEYTDDNGKKVHFRYRTEVYDDVNIDLSQQNNIDGVRVKLYESKGGDGGWCDGNGGGKASDLDFKFGDCITLPGVEGYHYKVVQFSDPGKKTPAQFLVQAYTDADCSRQKYAWSEIGGSCWGDAQVGFSFEMTTYPRTDVTPTPTPTPTPFPTPPEISSTSTTPESTPVKAPGEETPTASSATTATQDTSSASSSTASEPSTSTSTASESGSSTASESSTSSSTVSESSTATPVKGTASESSTSSNTASESSTSSSTASESSTSSSAASESSTSSSTASKSSTSSSTASESSTSSSTASESSTATPVKETTSTTTTSSTPTKSSTSSTSTTAESSTATSTSTSTASTVPTPASTVNTTTTANTTTPTPTPTRTPTPTTTATSSQSDMVLVSSTDSSSSDGTDAGAIVGGVVGGVAGVALLVGAGLYVSGRLRAGKAGYGDEDAFNTGLVVNSRAYSPATAENANPLYQNPDDSMTMV